MRIWDDMIYEIKEKRLKGKIITLASALLVLAGLAGIKQALPTSSTVGNRELPIYCVETSEPKIALTFDAAWAAGRLMEANPETRINTGFYSVSSSAGVISI